MVLSRSERRGSSLRIDPTVVNLHEGLIIAVVHLPLALLVTTRLILADRISWQIANVNVLLKSYETERHFRDLVSINEAAQTPLLDFLNTVGCDGGRYICQYLRP